MEYLKAFAVGGIICLIGQLLIDRTKLTPARILVGFVVAGVILSAFGLYQPIVDFAGAGATVPLSGFGHLIAKGVSCGRRAYRRAFRRALRFRRGNYRFGFLRTYCRVVI